MGIVRTNDPRANDAKHLIATCLGKLLDTKLSSETKKGLLDKLTSILQSKQITAESNPFIEHGFKTIYDVDDEGKRTLTIKVPKEYVPVSVTDDRDDQMIVFDLNKYTETSNEGSDSVLIEEEKSEE